MGYAIIFMVSIILHEVAHGWVAERCGDPTARQMGRITLNPLKHIDLFNTIILPVLCVLSHFAMIGGPKPVPVNPSNFRHPVRDDRLVSMAGVVVNLCIAWVLGMLLHLLLWTGVFTEDSTGTIILGMSIMSNLVLFIFNLTPIPPLDGSRLLRTFFPYELRRLFDRIDRFGMIILILVIQIPLFTGLLITGVILLWQHLLRLDVGLMVHVFRTFFELFAR